MKTDEMKIDGGLGAWETDSQKWLAHVRKWMERSLLVNERKKSPYRVPIWSAHGRDALVWLVCGVSLVLWSKSLLTQRFSGATWNPCRIRRLGGPGRVRRGTGRSRAGRYRNSRGS